MNETQIKQLLRDKGATATSIAEAADVSDTTVRQVISGKCKSRRIASVIALFLGKRIEDLWPGQYPATYTRRTPEKVARELRAAVMSVDARAA